MNFNTIKKIGIVAHSYEGGTLCFLTCCKEGSKLLGEHMHPNIIVSSIPMGLSMPFWEKNDFTSIEKYLLEGIEQVAKSGANFFICPDNTAHIVLENIIHQSMIPGLHIADVVCAEIIKNKWKKVGLLGTKWTMNGTVYQEKFKQNRLERVIPDEDVQNTINDAIFNELCQGVFKKETIKVFEEAIKELRIKGAQSVILGCTEIPLIINEENSVLPILDSTRLLAKYAVNLSVSKLDHLESKWLKLDNKGFQ